MTITELVAKLNSLTINDIEEMGEDVDGNPIFAVRIDNTVGSFIIGDMDIMDFPEWLMS